MKKIFLIVPVALLMAAGCNSQTAQQPAPVDQTPAVTQTPQDQTNPPQDQTPSQPEAFNLVKIPLNIQNNSGEPGTAFIYDVGGKATVVVKIANQPAKSSQPMHVHFGSCAQIGDVKYPLTNLASGLSRTTLSVSLADLVAQPFAINVHKSATEIGTYVSCGDSLSMIKSISTDPAGEAK